MSKKLLVLSFVLFSFLLSACNSPQQVANASEIHEPKFADPYTEKNLQEVKTNNCDGASPSTTITRSLEKEQTTTFKVEVGIGSLVAGEPIPQILRAELEAKIQAAIERTIGNRYQQSTEVVLRADPGTSLKHTLTWNEVKVKGIIDVVYPDGIGQIGFEKIIGVDLFDRTSIQEHCDGQPQPKVTEVIEIAVSPTPTNTPPALQPNESSGSKFPQRFVSENQIPNETSFVLKVDPGTIHTWTAGPVCVANICLSGGETRGSIIVMLPRDEPYTLTGLVPSQNWHGAYYGEANQWEILAQVIASDMKKPGSCTGGAGCSIVDVLVLGSNGVVSQYIE